MGGSRDGGERIDWSFENVGSSEIQIGRTCGKTTELEILGPRVGCKSPCRLFWWARGTKSIGTFATEPRTWDFSTN